MVTLTGRRGMRRTWVIRIQVGSSRYDRAMRRTLAFTLAATLAACAAQAPRPVTTPPAPVHVVGTHPLDLDAAVVAVDAAVLTESDASRTTLTEERDGVPRRLRALAGGRSCRDGDGDLSGLDAPHADDFQGCPAEGTPGRDAPLNVLKNRADEPPADAWECRDVAWMIALDVPAGLPREMRRFTEEQRAAIAPSSGRPVCLEGYIGGAKDSGPESPNCGGSAGVDHHIFLVPEPLPASELRRPPANAPRGHDTVVVETTPRLRAQHPTWTTAALRALFRAQTRVRVCGWTMLDPEHPSEVGGSRSTIWEVHPILHIDVQRDDGGWNEL